MDLLVSFAALVVASWLFLLIGLAITVESGWPPHFRQSRAGLDGRPFRMWKFRTMVKNAEALKAALMARNEAAYPAFKITNDPRVTRVGKLLRRSSLDELPQLINVLRGEMSLVGPRPLPVSESAQLPEAARRRLEVKPGITCIWQVTNRHSSGTSFDHWTDQDLFYVDHWSPSLDLALILRTIPAVLKMSGR